MRKNWGRFGVRLVIDASKTWVYSTGLVVAGQPGVENRQSFTQQLPGFLPIVLHSLSRQFQSVGLLVLPRFHSTYNKLLLISFSY